MSDSAGTFHKPALRGTPPTDLDIAWPLADAKLEQELLDLVQSATRT